MGCLLTRIANEVYVVMGLGTVNLTMVTVDAGIDVIIITIIEIQPQVIQGKAPGETVGVEVHLEGEVQGVIPQTMTMKVAVAQAVAVVQDVILPVPPVPPVVEVVPPVVEVVLPAEAAALVAAVG